VEGYCKIRKHHSQCGYKPTLMNIPRVTSKSAEGRSIDKPEFKSVAIIGKYYTNSKIRICKSKCNNYKNSCSNNNNIMLKSKVFLWFIVISIVYNYQQSKKLHEAELFIISCPA
jgi:hypothetical protein